MAFLDRAHVEPLHIKNNACAYAQRMLLNKIIAFSKLSNSINSFSQVPNTAALFRYVQTLKKKNVISTGWRRGLSHGLITQRPMGNSLTTDSPEKTPDCFSTISCI